MQGHFHQIDDTNGDTNIGVTYNSGGGSNGGQLVDSASTKLRAGGMLSDGTNGTPRTGDETRGATSAVLFVIKT
jgi:hypothetical protein